MTQFLNCWIPITMCLLSHCPWRLGFSALPQGGVSELKESFAKKRWTICLGKKKGYSSAAHGHACEKCSLLVCFTSVTVQQENTQSREKIPNPKSGIIFSRVSWSGKQNSMLMGFVCFVLFFFTLILNHFLFPNLEKSSPFVAKTLFHFLVCRAGMCPMWTNGKHSNVCY